MEEAESALALGDSVLGGGAAPAYATEPKLNQFASALDRVIRSMRSGHGDYRLYVCEEKVKSTSYNKDVRIGQSLVNSKAATTKRVVNYWCFSTGVALKELTDLGIRSVVLTSGTLSPMEAMKEDLRIPFMVELQNPHVIE
jgi:regulator of telomere elongation helicase 1